VCDISVLGAASADPSSMPPPALPTSPAAVADVFMGADGAGISAAEELGCWGQGFSGAEWSWEDGTQLPSERFTAPSPE
jgi:hypothetical protein